MPDVKVKNLRKEYGKKVVVDNLCFTAENGKLTTLLGPSGSGKSTAIRMISGLETPSGGDIWLGGREVFKEDVGELVPSEKRNIGMVFQSYALWPHKSVADNIGFPLRVRKTNKVDMLQKVKKCLDLVNLSGYENRLPGQLSGGEQQRVALARALVYEPEILLLDEPLANLDALIREQVRFELLEIQRRTGITMIYVTHDQSEAMVISDLVIILNEGKIMQEGPPHEVFDWPKSMFVANFLGVNNIIPAVYQSQNSATINDGRLITWDYQKYTSDRFSKGDPVYLSIRPNQIMFSGDERGNGSNVLKGKVMKEAYVGTMTEYWIESGCLNVRVQWHRGGGPGVGEDVDIIFDPTYVRLLPREE
ncbi:MAG: ABC transporter ATP-binding protein [Deltaproteobacteria bacterium]|nr:ABC transporter ATP-binding protein [Deltaproteobacteria bacterium]